MQTIQKLFFSALLIAVSTILRANAIYFLKPSEVMLYLKGALITETAEVDFQKGVQKLTLYHGSDALQTERLTLSSPDGVKIMSIRRYGITAAPQEYLPELRRIHDSINTVVEKIGQLQTEKLILDKELELLNRNMQVSGTQNGLVLEELRKTAEFFRTRLKQIYTELDQIKKRNNELQTEQKQLQERYNMALLSNGVTKTALEVTYFSEKVLSGKLALGYLIAQAGWTPFYNLRAEKLDAPLDLEYMARIRNQSGKDWNKVKILLSSYDPYQYGGLPILQKWYLDFQSKSIQIGLSNQYALKERSVRAENMAADAEEPAVMPVTIVRENALSLQYELGSTYSIPNGAQEETVLIQNKKISGQYRHVSIPKLDRDAFLICSVKNWNTLELLEGMMFMYLEGTYVGNSQVQTRYTGDSLELSMGRDKKVIVNRTKSLEFTKKQLLGSKITENRAYEIRVRNLRSTPIHLDLMDQVPISLRSEIEVSVDELSGASWTKDSGTILWKSDLQANETKTFKLAFTVKYPKDNPVELQ